MPFLIVLLLVAYLGSACTKAPTPTPIAEFAGQFQVDPVFRAFYDYNGGQDRLGKAISPPRKEGSVTVQFLETAKLVFDQNAPAERKFHLAPLGLEMGIQEPDTPRPASPELHYLNGHTISPDFYPSYEKLGAKLVGQPLTEEKYNFIRKRREQYFENLGFYRIEGDTQVRLLAYGAWVCGKKCAEGPSLSQAVIDIQSYIDPVFQDFVKQNGIDLTGFALTPAYLSLDGKWEQIFENVVLAADSRLSPQSVSPRPLSEKVHIMADAPRSQSDNPQMYFYPVQGDMGYEIPLYFWDYIQKHGGIAATGLPINHYAMLMDQVYHQCFVNLCLTYDQAVSESARVRAEPLGYPYRVLYYHSPEAEGVAPGGSGAAPALTPAETQPGAPGVKTPIAPLELTSPTAGAGGRTEVTPGLPPLPTQANNGQQVTTGDNLHEIDMQVWERYLVVGQQQGQEISIQVTENDRSMVGVQVEVTVIMPDGNKQLFPMPPTNEDGQASLLLPPMKASNGTIVPFKTCILTTDTRFCIADFFVIWETP